ncbi:MAG: OstA-like protein [Bacteroidales bacterium]
MLRGKLLNVFVLIFMLESLAVSSQESAKITIKQADYAKYAKALGENVYRVIGNAVFEHDGALLYCDSAWMNDSSNSLEAFSRIHIKMSDTLNLFGDKLNYNGNTRIAEVIDNVKLVDNQSVLTTNRLYFDRNTQVASYITGGNIVSKDNRLTSKKGYYHTDVKQAFFREDVVLKNPNNKINSDTLKYNTVTNIAYFFGPSIIRGKNVKNYMYCENGWYNTNTDISRFSKNALIVNGDQRMTGDSLFYDKKIDFGRAYRNIVVTDTVNNLVINGEYSEYSKTKGYSMITGKAMATIIDSKDSLFLHADTLYNTFDKEQKTKDLFAYYHAKFYRHDLQGASDSMLYRFRDSTILLYKTPILWSDDNQLTSDSIHILTSKKEIRQLMLYNSAFIISKDSGVLFNQIKGKNMTGFFKDNQLYRIDVYANAETIYFVREEDKSLIGINKALAGNMHIYLKDRKIEGITYLENPTATLYPEKDIAPRDLLLKDFKWHGAQRPLNKEQIFNWSTEKTKEEIKPKETQGADSGGL